LARKADELPDSPEWKRLALAPRLAEVKIKAQYGEGSSMAIIAPLDDVGTALLRLGLATAIGGALGIDRELHRKPAGLRTHALVALGAALATLIGIDVTASGRIADMGSLTRVVQGVLTGVGFIGAGVIFRADGGKVVKGLTTAATIWVVACLGVACGAGRWRTALVACGVTLAVLIFGVRVERALHRRIFPQDYGDSPEPATDHE
jgi:putative Mg2+ transporter-C (MgtC) family protein